MYTNNFIKSLCFYLLLTFVNKYIYILNTNLQIKVLPHLIIYIWLLFAVLVAGGASLVVLVVAGGVLPCVPPHIHSWTRRRGHARALQCGGALASELMVSGLFSKGDCSIYQLFRFSVWVTSYKGVVYVIRLLSIIYRGETIIHIQKNRKYLFNSIQNNQKPTIFARKQINL